MVKSIWRSILRRASIAAAAFVVGGASLAAQAAEKDTAYTLSLGTDFTSHFISYGFDVWQGGDDPSPFNPHSTIFSYATVSAAINDQWGVFVNLWGDINNNAAPSIGGSIQEIDLNVGVTYQLDKFGFTLANGFWNYGGDTEHVLDFTVGFNDGGEFTKGFAMNPSVTVHWRYNKHASQADEGMAIVPGIKPTYGLLADSKFPVSLSAPINVAFFTDDFQGGDGGYGYLSAGIGASVGLGFIPAKYGAWSVSGTVTYYNTPSEAIPGNPEDSFFVTAISIGMTI